MMSAEGEQEIVSQCLRSGAKNYLIKPIRIQNVKNLASHIDPSKKSKSVNPLNLTLEQYETIKLVLSYQTLKFIGKSLEEGHLDLWIWSEEALMVNISHWRSYKWVLWAHKKRKWQKMKSHCWKSWLDPQSSGIMTVSWKMIPSILSWSMQKVVVWATKSLTTKIEGCLLAMSRFYVLSWNSFIF